MAVSRDKRTVSLPGCSKTLCGDTIIVHEERFPRAQAKNRKQQQQQQPHATIAPTMIAASMPGASAEADSML
jgi:hypothetical protein